MDEDDIRQSPRWRAFWQDIARMREVARTAIRDWTKEPGYIGNEPDKTKH